MTDLTIESAGVSRRNLLRGAAWAAPVVAVAMTAPLAAATTPTVPRTIAGSAPSVLNRPPAGNGNARYTWEGTVSTPVITVTPTETTDTITAVSIVYWLPSNGQSVTWERRPGDDGLWSDAVELGSSVINGETLFGYQFVYVGPVIVGDGTTSIVSRPYFRSSWWSTTLADPMQVWRERRVTVNGEQYSAFTDGGTNPA